MRFCVTCNRNVNMKRYVKVVHCFGIMCCFSNVFCDSSGKTTIKPSEHSRGHLTLLTEPLKGHASKQPTPTVEVHVREYRNVTELCVDKCPCQLSDHNPSALLCLNPDSLDKFPYLEDSSLMGNITVM